MSAASVLRSLFYRLAIVAVWTFVILLVQADVILACTADWAGAANLTAVLVILLGILGSMFVATRRRRQLARAAARQQRAPTNVAATESPVAMDAGRRAEADRASPTPSVVRAGHPTRGMGRLAVDKDGSLWFAADRPGQIRDAKYFGLDLERVSGSRLLARRLATTFHPSLRRALLAEDRSFSIPRGQLRAVVAFNRFCPGPSVVIGYASDGGQTARFEEFLLSDKEGSPQSWPMPTADPDAWVRGLALPPVPEEIRKQAVRYRRTVHRHLARADVGLCAILYGVMYLFVGAILFSAVGAHEVLGLSAVILGLWALTTLFTSVILWFTYR